MFLSRTKELLLVSPTGIALERITCPSTLPIFASLPIFNPFCRCAPNPAWLVSSSLALAQDLRSTPLVGWHGSQEEELRLKISLHLVRDLPLYWHFTPSLICSSTCLNCADCSAASFYPPSCFIWRSTWQWWLLSLSLSLSQNVFIYKNIKIFLFFIAWCWQLCKVNVSSCPCFNAKYHFRCQNFMLVFGPINPGLGALQYTRK